MTIITPSQVREARALLGWSRDRLAALSEISVGCMEKFERERRTPEPSTLEAIRAALEAAGVEFTNDGTVKLAQRSSPKMEK